jgi:hypothetical protein
MKSTPRKTTPRVSTSVSTSPAVRRTAWRRVVASHALVLASGWGACALSLPEARRPALALAGVAALAVVAALITGWRIAGSLAVVLVGATPLLAGALDDDAASTRRLVVATVLVLLLVVGLDGVERRDPRESVPVVLHSSTRARRWVAPVVAVASCGLLGTVSVATVTPSVTFLLLGLLAGVGAVLAATRVH